MIETICLVDDNPIFLLAVKRILTLLEVCKHIITFPDGKEAMTYLNDLVKSQQKLPGLLLLDINMPVMNGWAFLDYLEKTDISDLNVYILTSSVDPADLERAKGYKKLRGYLTKPLTKESIDIILKDLDQ